MSVRTFAADTSVPVDRSRQEINRLLTDWQCAAIGWVDHLAEERVDCQFTWHRDGALYRVRFSIGIKGKVEATSSTRGSVWDPKAKKYFKTLSADERAQAWRSAHRLLLLKLKADLNAAQAGLAKAEEIFMPWMVDQNGRTLAEVMLPRLRDSYALLPPGSPPPPEKAP